jgi:hypothetical protein
MIFVFYNPPGLLKQDNGVVAYRGDDPALPALSGDSRWIK